MLWRKILLQGCLDEMSYGTGLHNEDFHVSSPYLLLPRRRTEVFQTSSYRILWRQYTRG